MTEHIARVLQHMFPGSIPGEDYLLQDDGDGPYIKKWNLPGEPPSEEHINKTAKTIGDSNDIDI